MLKLVISDDEGKTMVIPLTRDELTIGRKDGNSIRLTERNVSRRHARIVKRSEGFFLEDLASYNGIVINDKMGRLSRALLGTAKPIYRRFLLANLMDGFGGLLRFGLALQIWGLLAVALFLLRLVGLPQPWAATSIPQPQGTPTGPSPALQAIAAISLSLALSSVFLVALTVVNVGRHSTAAGILLPSLLAYWAFREGREMILGFSPGASRGRGAP